MALTQVFEETRGTESKSNVEEEFTLCYELVERYKSLSDARERYKTELGQVMRRRDSKLHSHYERVLNCINRSRQEVKDAFAYHAKQAKESAKLHNEDLNGLCSRLRILARPLLEG